MKFPLKRSWSSYLWHNSLMQTKVGRAGCLSVCVCVVGCRCRSQTPRLRRQEERGEGALSGQIHRGSSTHAQTITRPHGWRLVAWQRRVPLVKYVRIEMSHFNFALREFPYVLKCCISFCISGTFLPGGRALSLNLYLIITFEEPVGLTSHIYDYCLSLRAERT